MQRILIIDNNNRLKQEYHFIETLFPESQVYKAPAIVEAMKIIEHDNEVTLFLDVDCLNDSKLETIIRKREVPIILLSYNNNNKYDKVYEVRNKMKVIGEILCSGEKTFSLKDYRSPNKVPAKVVVLPTRQQGWFLVSPDSIVAIVKEDTGLLVYTKKQSIKKVKSTLSDIAKQCSNSFVYVNRQSVIDLNAITRMVSSKKEIYIRANKEEIKFIASRQKWKELITLLGIRDE
jgi:Response regulator of the LytR/AlgR family